MLIDSDVSLVEKRANQAGIGCVSNLEIYRVTPELSCLWNYGKNLDGVWWFNWPSMTRYLVR